MFEKHAFAEGGAYAHVSSVVLSAMSETGGGRGVQTLAIGEGERRWEGEVEGVTGSKKTSK